ncbi:hypothetical protein HDV01_002356 [Terramyces sp. JEL0728]|nr:hypothetical protein HDV01_002356 [Terramyces sp. JEL0728]
MCLRPRLETVKKVGASSNLALKLTDKIAIVGGGPAGLHFASLLAKQGFKDVTLLETSSHVGGKSLTVLDNEGIPHEMGTCYLSSVYDNVRSLLAEYDPTNQLIDITHRHATFDEVLGSDIQTPSRSDSDPADGMDLSLWYINEMYIDNAADPAKTPTDNLVAAFQKYIGVHLKLFGNYSYGLPPKPADFKAINMTAIEFLQNNGLMALEGLLRYAQQTQGYGVLEDVPAFYMLWWIHPELLVRTLEGYAVQMLSKGFQHLWQSVYEKHKKDVNFVFNARVKSISRGLDGSKPTITYGHDEKTVHFDRLVMAVDLSTHLGLISDLTAEEKTLFSGYTSSVLTTTLYESDKGVVEYPIEYWFKRMTRNPPGGVQGRLYAQRNSKLALFGTFNNVTNTWNASGRQKRIGYQYLGRPMQKNDSKTMLGLLKTDLVTETDLNAEIILQKPHRYFPRFGTDGILAGKPWGIVDIQGKSNTLWIGSSVCFESVLDVMTYNTNLFSRLQISK